MPISDKKTLTILNRKVLEAYGDLQTCLDDLAMFASDIMGYDLSAYICTGGEIELRKPGEDFDAIRIEDIYEEIEKRAKK